MIFKIKQNFYLIISTTYYATSIKNTQKVCVRSSLPEATTIHRRISQEHQKHFLQAWFQLALWLMGKRFNFGESRFGTPSSGIPCLPRPPSISPSWSHRRNSIPERTVPEKPNDWMGWIYGVDISGLVWHICPRCFQKNKANAHWMLLHGWLGISLPMQLKKISQLCGRFFVILFC